MLIQALQAAVGLGLAAVYGTATQAGSTASMAVTPASQDWANSRASCSRWLLRAKADLAMDVVRDGAHQVREKSAHLRDATTTYIQHEPVKSMLMAAAVGAALMGLVALFSRHHSGHNGR